MLLILPNFRYTTSISYTLKQEYPKFLEYSLPSTKTDNFYNVANSFENNIEQKMHDSTKMLSPLLT